MAKKRGRTGAKGRRRPRTIGAELSKLKRRFVASLWGAIMLFVLYFVGRYVALDVYSADKSRRESMEVSMLEEVHFPAGVDNMKVVYKGFTVYFNSRYHVPNCVIYELTGKETEGKFPRYKNFMTDEQVPGCANPWDYTHSGYTRGHMAPAADMKWDREVMKESFYMTNICPQKAALNSGGWNKLEDKVRDWARRDSSLIVASGPVLTEGMSTIGESRVAVPKHFFKVVMAPFVDPPRAIAFIYPNGSSKGAIKKYAVTVDEVERLTGIDFFPGLDDDAETELESGINLLQWELSGR